jgi:hypothetical protein
VADDQRDEAHRPAETYREHSEHRARGGDAPEREQQQAECQDHGHDTGDLAVAGGPAHLVGEQRGDSGDAGLDRGELRAQIRDRAPYGEDRRSLCGEGARRLGQIDDDVQKAIVVGEKVAVVRERWGGGRDEGHPG